MTAEPRLRRAADGDRAAILALVEESFGAGGFLHDPAFWRWKHETNPFGPSPMWVAEAGGGIVALRAFLRWRFQTGGREVEAVRAVDTATRPAWRRRGLFARLTGEALGGLREEGVGLVFNTPNRFSLPGYRKLGWRRVTRAPVWIRPRRPWGLAFPGRGGGAEWPEAAEGDAAGLDRLLGSPELPALLAAAAGEKRYHTLRSPAYLRWRYREIPLGAYAARWRPPRGGEGGCAVIFRRRRRRGRSELGVAELLVAPAAVAPAARLLRRLAREGDADYLTACAAFRTPESAVLLRAGFLPLPGLGPWLAVRPLGAPPGAPEPLAARSWRLTLGDLEIF